MQYLGNTGIIKNKSKFQKSIDNQQGISYSLRNSSLYCLKSRNQVVFWQQNVYVNYIERAKRWLQNWRSRVAKK